MAREIGWGWSLRLGLVWLRRRKKRWQRVFLLMVLYVKIYKSRTSGYIKLDSVNAQEKGGEGLAFFLVREIAGGNGTGKQK